MAPWVQIVITIISSLIASSGFWAYMTRVIDHRDIKTKLLLGLAHDRIVETGMIYVERGWITQEEHESLHDGLYKYYVEAKGNGTVKRIMKEVDNLPIRKSAMSESLYYDDNEVVR